MKLSKKDAAEIIASGFNSEQQLKAITENMEQLVSSAMTILGIIHPTLVQQVLKQAEEQLENNTKKHEEIDKRKKELALEFEKVLEFVKE